MRISVRHNDKGYPTFYNLCVHAQRALVKLNGEPQHSVVTADDEVGMVRRLLQPLIYDHDRQEFVDEVVHGKVEIEVYSPDIL